jgi:predicted phosphodiesterase
MRYGIFSDIHANLEALEAVLAALEEARVDEMICLGDVVGYGPNPNECITLVKEKVDFCLAGNHDVAPLGGLDVQYFNYVARKAIEWTAKELSEDSKAFLRSLPMTQAYDTFFIVHATPVEPEKWSYILSMSDAIENFSGFSQQTCFVGHSHSAWCVEKSTDGRHEGRENYPITLNDSARYLINVGSVGQPRDRNPAAACGVLDVDNKTYELRRVPYDIPVTQKKILAAGLPELLAERLALGQ